MHDSSLKMTTPEVLTLYLCGMATGSCWDWKHCGDGMSSNDMSDRVSCSKDALVRSRTPSILSQSKNDSQFQNI